MIFCRERTDEEMMGALAGKRQVLIVGCPACANASLYIDRGDDAEAMLALSMKGFRPLSMLAEVERLQELLGRDGRTVTSWVGHYPLNSVCMLNRKTRARLTKASVDADAVLALCCEGGAGNLAGFLGEERTIPAMRAEGLTSAVPRKRKGMGRLAVDRSTVRITPLTVTPNVAGGQA